MIDINNYFTTWDGIDIVTANSGVFTAFVCKRCAALVVDVGGWDPEAAAPTALAVHMRFHEPNA